MKKIITRNETETFNLGVELGRKCRGGEVFALSGDLGAGKTKLLQGMAKGLGVKNRVNSPTFNILKIYKAGGKVRQFCHIDAYRLESGRDLEVLGVSEYMKAEDTVTAIEWAERVEEILSPKTKKIRLTRISENERDITIS